ncbi:hypothetical protein Q9233_006663 [Columba guinea]|nr:hypothetical protein Q9233_006663 [Columba guinea]
MATLVCRVQLLDDTDPFNSTNFPEPTRPPLYTFREDIPLATQLPGVHRLLRAPQKLDDCTLQLSHNGTYLDLESTLAEQRDELEGFQEDAGHLLIQVQGDFKRKPKYNMNFKVWVIAKPRDQKLRSVKMLGRNVQPESESY